MINFNKDAMKNKYYLVYNRYLAEGLVFLGHKYYRKEINEQTVFSFKLTEEFKKDIKDLLALKQNKR